ncbi:hypothetical protein R1sor_007527 [Riccia sorocarpa]|uniref:Uncharacterized protein n=1 Tax=Riccia sorocarpa TaxID=122646 RepID=A0ABD3HSW2_9MARC
MASSRQHGRVVDKGKGLKHRNLQESMGTDRGLAGGSGSISNWKESVDHLLDTSPIYTSAVRAAYSRFCLPTPESAIPPALLLSALQYFLQVIVEGLDAKAGKVCLRPVTQEDVDTVMRHDETLAEKEGQLIDFATFDLCARSLLKRVALDRGKRLGLFMLGGIIAVHMAKSTVRKIPFIGPPISALVNALVPTTIVGPVVGVAGAMYL